MYNLKFYFMFEKKVEEMTDEELEYELESLYEQMAEGKSEMGMKWVKERKKEAVLLEREMDKRGL